MVDEVRSRTMRAVKSTNTRPEVAVRKLVYAMGFRYRLHGKELPGSPDLVFRSRRKAIFVHGCFWHGHDCKRGARLPKTNVEYWSLKIQRNRERDFNSLRALKDEGWKCLVVWECELKDQDALRDKLLLFLHEDANLCDANGPRKLFFKRSCGSPL